MPAPEADNDRYGRFVALHSVATQDPASGLTLRLAEVSMPVWEAAAREIGRGDLPAPFWAFVWAGGAGLVRWLRAHPEVVCDRDVFDFAAGSGVVGLSAARLGARSVVCNDVCPFACAALVQNASLNGLTITVDGADRLGQPLQGSEVLLAGDICYERPVAERVARWMRDSASRGTLAILADPSRAYAPREGFEEVDAFEVETSFDLEGVSRRRVRVLRALPW